MHRLRKYVDQISDEEISDEELIEFETLIDFDDCLSMEYAGNFIITKNLVNRELEVETMCCGIETKDIKLSNGEWIYFAYDWGH